MPFPRGCKQVSPNYRSPEDRRSAFLLTPYLFRAHNCTVARIVSSLLSRNRTDPGFEISILTCSITYMWVYPVEPSQFHPSYCYLLRHRQHFRSDVLVTFHPPLHFRPKVRRSSLWPLTPNSETPQDNPELLEPVHYDNIRHVTAQMHRQIATGTFDAPSWDLIRAAKTATPIYAPLGTAMSLGDYVRVTGTFLEVFKAASLIAEPGPKTDQANQEVMISDQLENKDIVRLKEDIQVSQSHLSPRPFLSYFLNYDIWSGVPVRTVSVAD